MLKYIRNSWWESKAKSLFKELFDRFHIAADGKIFFTNTKNSQQKAYTFFDEDGRYQIVIDLDKHASMEDVENSVYHEFRHLMQQEMLDEEYLRRCRRLKLDMAWYLFSPTEIDARVFAKTKGEIADRQVFETIGRLDDFATSKLFLYHCMDVSRKYGVG